MANKIKFKTHRASAKRFKRTGSGQLKRYQGGKSHMTGHYAQKRIRSLRKSRLVSASDMKRIDKMLPR
ncbi:MAG: 50S ribosomal protein L35 [Peptoniphilaceae bacterium]|nr:50S ribosomal protein L35 [Peptoniphilaceae bacterium]MCI6660620.1 50S ribosomal protein L35 [Peptoniphilaceae bacterium]MDD7434673.1 50S ribosomal protein L35 [Peptoniphilaceae bacterium]MDD7542974.1 50S ribosomal protein L35 [Peptoniphilaceae bacterium]MDY3075874.1 50S ribosomal protein L35 [Peptoniphilaceae bacterium]